MSKKVSLDSESKKIAELVSQLTHGEQKDILISRMKSAADSVASDFKRAKNISTDQLRKPFTV